MRGCEGDPRIVITGMGAVTPLGKNLPTTWDNMMAGKSGITEGDYSPTDVRVAGKINDFSLEEHFAEPFDIAGRPTRVASYEKRLSPAAQYGLTASHEALKEAGLIDDSYNIIEGIDRERIGCAMGTGVGGTEVIGDIQHIIDRGDGVSGSFDILKVLPDRTSAVPSVVFKLAGPTHTVSSACASGSTAITSGIREILTGNADAMLVGGAEAAVHQKGIALFLGKGARTLTRETDVTRASRPFDEDRDGFVIGEGAGAMVIETLEHALRRGATPIVELVGYGDTSDAYHETAPSGKGAARALALALLGLSGFVDGQEIYVNAHATSTKEGDPIEARVIREAFPNATVIYVNAPKSQLGHSLGTAGAVESVLAVKTLTTGGIPPVLHLDNPIAETDGLDVVRGVARVNTQPTLVINDSFGFGGFNSTLAMKRYEGPMPKREV